MKEIGIEVLNIIYNYGYEGYIVGGFVRDCLLGIKSVDIDITTNATPMELKNIFPSIEISNRNYGSVTLNYKNCRFEITTYRKDMEYMDNRHPSSIVYVNDLKIDLLRRDFTINTICMNKDGVIIDLLNGKFDLDNKIIRSIGESNKSFQDDALRILRAIRFATILDFEISDEVKSAIITNKHLLKKLSYERKKHELDRIFASSRAKEGIKLINEYELSEILELPNLDRIKDYSDIVGIWAMINTDVYPFTNSEKELIEKINVVYNLDNLDNEILYKYGLYVNVIAGINKGFLKRNILEKYDNLPIKERSEIKITAKEICSLLNKTPGAFITKIYIDLEKQILLGKLNNENMELREYIVSNYC